MKSLVAVLTLSAALASGAWAQPAPADGSGAPTMTVEQRQKMADAHEKMAACLRSERPLDECHAELMASCKAAMGVQACPMMGGMRHGWKGKRGPPAPAN